MSSRPCRGIEWERSRTSQAVLTTAGDEAKGFRVDDGAGATGAHVLAVVPATGKAMVVGTDAKRNNKPPEARSRCPQATSHIGHAGGWLAVDAAHTGDG